MYIIKERIWNTIIALLLLIILMMAIVTGIDGWVEWTLVVVDILLFSLMSAIALTPPGFVFDENYNQKNDEY